MEPGPGRLSAAGVARDARRAVRGGPAAVGARRAARLDAMVAHARRSSAFYAEHYRDVPEGPLGPGGLAALPPVRKPELMARFDEWVTDPAVTREAVAAFVADPAAVGTDLLGRYAVFTTSGSTGTPALLVQDRDAIAVMTGLAYARSAGVLPPRLLGRALAHGARQAAVFAGGGHFLAATMFERRLRAHPWRRRTARWFSVQEPLPVLVERLNAFRPAMLASYASVLTVLAEEQEAGRLRIRPVVVSSGGELLTPAARHRVEAAFGAAVVESYSASEATPLALPCRRGELHVNSDWFLLEPVDAAGRPVPPGRRSDGALVTNLANRVQPVIRYDLGDSVVLGAQPCPCGTPLPTVRVEGRTDEILRVPGAGGAEVVLLPMALSTVVEETPGVRRHQVLQTGPAALAVRLEPVPGTDPEELWRRVAQRLDEFLRRQGAPGVTVRRAAEAPRPDPRSGKLRHVVGPPPAGR